MSPGHAAAWLVVFDPGVTFVTYFGRDPATGIPFFCYPALSPVTMRMFTQKALRVRRGALQLPLFVPEPASAGG